MRCIHNVPMNNIRSFAYLISSRLSITLYEIIMQPVKTENIYTNSIEWEKWMVFGVGRRVFPRVLCCAVFASINFHRNSQNKTNAIQRVRRMCGNGSTNRNSVKKIPYVSSVVSMQNLVLNWQNTHSGGKKKKKKRPYDFNQNKFYSIIDQEASWCDLPILCKFELTFLRSI